VFLPKVFLLAVEANVSTPTNLGHAQNIFSLSFEVTENPSLEYLHITQGSVFTGGIKNQ
jgi:hypothetical protein